MKRIDSNLSSFPEPSANVPVLLLTAAVDARNGRDCLFSTEARKRQYLGAFRFYMRFLARHPDLCTGIVFCENSGADLAPFRSLVPDEFRSRVEFVSLPIDGFRPEMGKSWNEMRALDLTLERAGLIGSDDLFVKLTGRYPIHNIRRLVSDLVSTRFRIAVSCFRWPEGRRLSPHPPLCDTRCIAFRKSVWTDCFRGLYATADIDKGRHFETIAEEVVSRHETEPGWGTYFTRPPLIVGKQGGVKRVAGVKIPKCVEPVLLLGTYLLHRFQLSRSLRSPPLANLRAPAVAPGFQSC